MKRDIGIDLGASRISVFASGQGVIFHTPALLARSRINGEILGFGNNAGMLLERTPGNVKPDYPLYQGIAVQYDAIRDLLSYVMDEVFQGKNTRPRLVLTVSASLTEHEEKSYIDAALEAGAKEVYLIQKSVAAALGAGVDIAGSTASLVIDLGAARTEVAAIALGGAVQSKSIPIGGRKMDEAIQAYVGEKYGAEISLLDAEALKLQSGTVWINDSSKTSAFVPCIMRGMGVPQTVTVTPDDIAEAIAERVDTLSAQISTAIARIPEELLNDVRQSKMYLTGGMALLNGMDQVIMDAVGIPARVAADARDCTVRGLGEALQTLDRMDTDIAKVFRMQRPENKD